MPFIGGAPTDTAGKCAATARFTGLATWESAGASLSSDGGLHLLMGAPDYDNAYRSDGPAYLLLSGGY